MRDSRMREQAHVIQAEVRKMLDDVARLDTRVGSLERHFDQAVRDIGQIRTSTEKITSRGTKITEIELGDDGEEIESENEEAPALAEPKADVAP
jgi:DNA recombination protein RmuC